MEKYIKQIIAPAIAIASLILVTNGVFADNSNNTTIVTGNSCSSTEVQTWINTNGPIDWNVEGQHPDCNPSATPVSSTSTPTPSVCQSPTPSPKPSLSPSCSPSISPSILPSPSTYPSPSTNPSPSVNPSVSPSPSTLPTPSAGVTPTPTSTSGNGGNNGGGSGGGSGGSGGGGSSSAPGCSQSAPLGVPNLYQVNLTGNSATIYFVPVSGVTGYSISYGSNSNADSFGVSFNSSQTTGAEEYTINNLYPGMWYFKVRGQNGCMPGSWSNTLSSNGVLTTSVLGASTGPQVLGLSYTSGDNTIPFAFQSMLALICGGIGVKFLRKSY